MHRCLNLSRTSLCATIEKGGLDPSLGSNHLAFQSVNNAEPTGLHISVMDDTHKSRRVVAVPFHGSHKTCDDFVYVRPFWLRKIDRSFSCAYAWQRSPLWADAETFGPSCIGTGIQIQVLQTLFLDCTVSRASGYRCKLGDFPGFQTLICSFE